MFSLSDLNKIKDLRYFEDNPSGLQVMGKVAQVVGNTIEAFLTEVPLGALVRITNKEESFKIDGEVVGFRDNKALIIPYNEPTGVSTNALVYCIEKEQKIYVGDHLIGKIIDPYGKCLQSNRDLNYRGTLHPLHSKPINPLIRRRIDHPIDLGIRSINSLLTCGEGQRIGIMSGSGVGKSALMGMMSRFTDADINVITLIGERGREVLEFVEQNLGREGLQKTVVVVSTSDQSPLSRIRGAYVGTAIAEHFRDKGKKVLFMMDSLTRVAMAQREIGLSVGEPPTTKGYPPSVFSLLPKLLERTGNTSSKGSITGIYTVLVDGDDFNEPICDAARSILDGHIVLSRRNAEKGHFPAIDILKSISRVMLEITDEKHKKLSQHFKELLHEYEKNEDLINIGAYNPGFNEKLDKAVKLNSTMNAFLKQDLREKCTLKDSVDLLEKTLILDEEKK